MATVVSVSSYRRLYSDLQNRRKNISGIYKMHECTKCNLISWQMTGGECFVCKTFYQTIRTQGLFRTVREISIFGGWKKRAAAGASRGLLPTNVLSGLD